MTTQLPSNVLIDISKHALIKQAHDVIQAIEECGASTALTNAVTKASALMQDIANLLAAYEQEPVAGDAYTTPTGDEVIVSSIDERFALLTDGSRIRKWFLKHKCKKHPAPSMKPVGYLFVSDEGAVAYSPTNWDMPGFKCAGQVFGKIDELPAPFSSNQVDELVMWVKRLAHSLKKVNPDNKLHLDAMDYLKRKTLIDITDVLRDTHPAPVVDHEQEPDYIRYDCGCCGFETIDEWRDNDVCPKCNHKPLGKTELYTHTAPSIQAAVPDVITAEDVRWMLKQADHDDGPSCRIEHAEYIGAMMWNACRAAMLQAEPAGWIPVSERLSPLEAGVLVARETGE